MIVSKGVYPAEDFLVLEEDAQVKQVHLRIGVLSSGHFERTLILHGHQQVIAFPLFQLFYALKQLVVKSVGERGLLNKELDFLKALLLDQLFQQLLSDILFIIDKHFQQGLYFLLGLRLFLQTLESQH